MSSVFISHTSALLIHRNDRNQTYAPAYATSKLVPKSRDKYSAIEFLDVKNLYSGVLNSSLDVVVSNTSTTKSNGVYIHKFNGKFPKNSFFEIQKDVLIASPELTFCQMAQVLNVENLILYGMEICGTYSICENVEKGFYSDRAPLTSVDRLWKYFEWLRNLNTIVKGARKIEQALRVIKENSASPQESRLYIMLCAPSSMGGYNLSGVLLNEKIQLSRAATKICNKNFLVADLCIKKHKIVIEYDSDKFHNNADQNNRDKARINALFHDKWKVYNIVPAILKNEEAFHNIAIDIIRATGKRPRFRSKDFNYKKSELFCNLNS